MEENEKEMGATAASAGENAAESAGNAGENEESKKAEAAAGEEPEGAAEAGAEAPEEEPEEEAEAFDEAGEAAPGRTISEEEYAQAIAEAEQRGYLRGRNEQIDALMEESPEAEGVEILQHPRVSIWDL